MIIFAITDKFKSFERFNIICAVIMPIFCSVLYKITHVITKLLSNVNIVTSSTKVFVYVSIRSKKEIRHGSIIFNKIKTSLQKLNVIYLIS